MNCIEVCACYGKQIFFQKKDLYSIVFLRSLIKGNLSQTDILNLKIEFRLEKVTLAFIQPRKPN